MGTTRADIGRWFDEAKKAGATHMIIVCDEFDHGDFPVRVMPGEDVREKAEKERCKQMQRVMEVYSMSMDKDAQLAEHRAFHYD